MKLSELEIDVKAEDEGDWVKIPDYDDFEIKSRSIHNADYRRMNQRLTRALIKKVGAKKYSRGDFDHEKQDKITNQCLLETCTQDFRGLTSEDGEPLKCTRETLVSLMTERKYRVFQNAAAYAASVVGDKELQIEEDTEKNLLNPSAGSTAGEGKKASSKKSRSTSGESPAH